jgi:hypothetical protein
MKHVGNIDFDQVSVGTVLMSLAALSMAVAAYLLG